MDISRDRILYQLLEVLFSYLVEILPQCSCTEKKILHGCEISVNFVRDHQPKLYTITDFP